MHRSALLQGQKLYDDGMGRTLPSHKNPVYYYAYHQAVMDIEYSLGASNSVVDEWVSDGKRQPTDHWRLYCPEHGYEKRCPCMEKMIRLSMDTGLWGAVVLPMKRENVYARIRCDRQEDSTPPWPNTSMVRFSLPGATASETLDYPVSRLGVSRLDLIYLLKEVVDTAVAKDDGIARCDSSHHSGDRDLRQKSDHYAQMLHCLLSDATCCLDCDEVNLDESYLQRK